MWIIWEDIPKLFWSDQGKPQKPLVRTSGILVKAPK